MVGDERAHDDRLASAGGHLEGDAREIVDGVAIDGLRTGDFAESVLAGIGFFGDLVEPNGRFDGLALREKEMIFASRVEKPEVQQFLGDAGGVGIGGVAPDFHLVTE